MGEGGPLAGNTEDRPSTAAVGVPIGGGGGFLSGRNRARFIPFTNERSVIVSFDSPFGGDDGDDTRTEILRATYEALTEHGYENLTIERIGERFPKSKSLIYQHYESKDDMIIALLGFLLDHLEAQLPKSTAGTPHDALENVLNFALAPGLEAEHAELRDVLIEVRGQAPHNGAIREYFTTNDRAIRRGLSDIVSRGIDEGIYRQVDPDGVADFILTAMNGHSLQRATTEDIADVASVRAELDAYLEARLLRERQPEG
jgi:AcrR family transcriptional regulator